MLVPLKHLSGVDLIFYNKQNVSAVGDGSFKCLKISFEKASFLEGHLYPCFLRGCIQKVIYI